ncbi:BrnA antitoxin family protein [Ottowia sp.]|uniref:BrnA antitoxin family protein n=1 Tax=Ottowia sp. TaxID=1898956 RepID=UPI0026049D76|nr:BrnA antitoxin family protein [Ottowia sp.]
MPKTPASKMDAEMLSFANDVAQSIRQAKTGEYARVTTGAQLATRKRGRPTGSVQAVTKEPVKLRLDADVLAALRATGDGWQTRINDTLRASLHLAGKV